MRPSQIRSGTFQAQVAEWTCPGRILVELFRSAGSRELRFLTNSGLWVPCWLAHTSNRDAFSYELSNLQEGGSVVGMVMCRGGGCHASLDLASIYLGVVRSLTYRFHEALLDPTLVILGLLFGEHVYLPFSTLRIRLVNSRWVLFSATPRS